MTIGEKPTPQTFLEPPAQRPVMLGIGFREIRHTLGCFTTEQDAVIGEYCKVECTVYLVNVNRVFEDITHNSGDNSLFCHRA